VHECLITRDWKETGAIVEALVARRSPSGQVAIGAFMIDLGCLGVKDASYTLVDESEYRHSVRPEYMSHQPTTTTSLDLVAKVVREAVAYARRWGFSPHRDFGPASLMLEGAHPEDCSEDVPLGYQGKPYYTAGPYDNPTRILKRLERTAGPGNYNYTVLFSGEKPPPGRADDLLGLVDVDEEAEDEDDRGEGDVRGTAVG
jgi:hypothetical protein